MLDVSVHWNERRARNAFFGHGRHAAVDTRAASCHWFLELGAVMANVNFDESTRREWRELGFFYDREDSVGRWRIVGTAEGLRRFASMVSAYASDTTNDSPSEHQHFGPYRFLELGTWHEPEITQHWIAGPVSDLAALAAHVRESIPSLTVGVPRSVRAAFSPTSAYDLVLELRSEPFDPAGEDRQC